MARTELQHGIILPAEYSDDWYDDMTSNLSKLDEVIGSDAEKLSEEDVGAAALSNDYTDLDNKPALKPVATSGDYDDLDNKPALKPVATSGDYDDLDNKPALKPVATSGDYDDLDNKPALKPVATSGNYDDLTDLPTYGITRLCSSAITDNSTVAFSAISSTNKIKVGDFLLDTNGKLYQISSVDTANESVSVTTPLTQLAVDSSVVHKSGDETVGGVKTFSSSPLIYNSNSSASVPQINLKNQKVVKSSTTEIGVQSINFTDKNNNVLGQIEVRAISNGSTGLNITAFGFDPNNQNISSGIQILRSPTTANFAPNADNAVTCGRSLAKWSDVQTYKINALEPSSLSLPSGNISDIIDISGYITILDGSNVNTYVAPANGWISILMNNCSSVQGYITGLWGNQIIRPSVGSVRFFMPVLKNKTVNILILGGTIGNARFIPCQGNI